MDDHSTQQWPKTKISIRWYQIVEVLWAGLYVFAALKGSYEAMRGDQEVHWNEMCYVWLMTGVNVAFAWAVCRAKLRVLERFAGLAKWMLVVALLTIAGSVMVEVIFDIFMGMFLPVGIWFLLVFGFHWVMVRAAIRPQ